MASWLSNLVLILDKTYVRTTCYHSTKYQLTLIPTHGFCIDLRSHLFHHRHRHTMGADIKSNRRAVSAICFRSQQPAAASAVALPMGAAILKRRSHNRLGRRHLASAIDGWLAEESYLVALRRAPRHHRARERDRWVEGGRLGRRAIPGDRIRPLLLSGTPTGPPRATR